MPWTGAVGSLRQFCQPVGRLDNPEPTLPAAEHAVVPSHGDVKLGIRVVLVDHVWNVRRLDEHRIPCTAS